MTGTIPSGTDIPAPPDPLAPDVAGAVARIREKRGPGRPKGSKNKPKGGVETDKPEPQAPVEVSEVDVAGASQLGATVWKIAGGIMGYRPLTDSEAGELGQALAPVLKKYMPFFEQWALEINLGVTILGLAQLTRIPKPAPDVKKDAPPNGG